MTPLLTGGSGRLGTELKKLRDFYAPTRNLLDITTANIFPYTDLVVHCAAYTDVDKAEDDADECIETNVGGTLNLALAYPGVPFVLISSEHAPHAINIYGASKYASEEVVKRICRRYLIIRTLFKPTPWPFDNAWDDQITQGDYTPVIAKKILKAIDNWDKETCKTILVGTGRKSIYDLAKQTRPDVEPSSRLDHPGKARRPASYE
jgi:dTDP-4-dehydrorhamnose reductase